VEHILEEAKCKIPLLPIPYILFFQATGDKGAGQLGQTAVSDGRKENVSESRRGSGGRLVKL
jgi:hypothetical protein